MKRIQINIKSRKLIENIFSLSVLNIINYIFPLILIPYLTRVLGVESFGVYSFIFALATYMSYFVRYGFEFSATKLVAINRENLGFVNQIFNAIFIIRLFISFLMLFLICLFFLVFPQVSIKFTNVILSFGIVLGLGLFPIWLFQGMEDMKFITIVNFIIRLLSVILIFFFVKKEGQLSLVILFQSLGYLFGGFLSVLIAIKKYKFNLYLPTKSELVFQLKDGWHLFLSNLGINLYRDSNVILLGLFTNYTYVGYYAPAEKIVKAVQSLSTPFVSALFPFLSREINDNMQKGLKLFNKISKYLAVSLFFIALFLFLFSNYIIDYYLGHSYLNSILNIRVMSLIVFLGGLNYYYGIIGLSNLGLQRFFVKYVWIVGIVNVTLTCILMPFYKDLGASIAIVFAEFLLLILVFKRFNK